MVGNSLIRMGTSSIPFLASDRKSFIHFWSTSLRPLSLSDFIVEGSSIESYEES